MSLILPRRKLLLSAQDSGLDVADVFNISLWAGNNAARTIVTGINGEEGALVWIKSRSDGIQSHSLWDTGRIGRELSSNLPNSEVVVSGGFRTLISSDGFQIEGGRSGTNASGQTYVGWQWKRSPKFFDIVTYTGNGVAGRQIAHDLGIAPGMVIVKRIDSSGIWAVYHRGTGAAKILQLEDTGAAYSNSAYWNNTEPSDASFTVGNNAYVNTNGGTYIAYLFAHDPEDTGLIQCGAYTGNGSAAGPIVDLGWEPQYLMIKSASSTGDWIIVDAARGLAANDPYLRANTSASESSGNLISVSSAGFQLVINWGDVNASGRTYIYMAIRKPTS